MSKKVRNWLFIITVVYQNIMFLYDYIISNIIVVLVYYTRFQMNPVIQASRLLKLYTTISTIGFHHKSKWI
ncbi:hypothetical protein Indivirus_5_54 [Indivirus ILV1]|uniref:Uncharacterized protein n=1 Tax=Indivirus ILV1 TaxID=1977633 RepID=A0A1V0SE18_9VIRU|nr:hypothetical protein Indivirus_5_54 [Indivirus ILV1]